MKDPEEDDEVSCDPPASDEGIISSITHARREAAYLYRSWKRGRRRIKPHECAVLVSSLSNIAGMIEKERDQRVEVLEREIELLRQEIAESRGRPLPVSRDEWDGRPPHALLS